LCVTFDDALFDGPGVRAPRLGEVLENVLGRLGLARARLAAHDDRLVAAQCPHVAVRLVSCISNKHHHHIVIINSVWLDRWRMLSSKIKMPTTRRCWRQFVGDDHTPAPTTLSVSPPTFDRGFESKR